MRQKIYIKGAGLAGLTSAIALSQNKILTEVQDIRKSVGSFFNVDVHSFKNYGFGQDIDLYLKKLNIDLKNYLDIKSFYYVAPNGRYIKVRSNNTIFTNIVRGNREDSLDNLLKKRAETLGVKFNFNSKSDKEFQIIASGSKKADVIGYGAHFRNVHLDSEYIFLDNDFAPGGYIYLSPYLNNEASLVIVSYKNNFNIKDAYNKFVSNNVIIKEKLKNAEKICDISGVANFNVPKTAILNKKLYVGEAAGFMDAGRGFGMHYAITSGYLAAKAIYADSNYDELWKKQFGKELFERFARRQYLNILTNNDHNKIIEETIKKYGVEIPLEVYQNRKETSWYKKLLLETYAKYKLISWRRNHPLE